MLKKLCLFSISLVMLLIASITDAEVRVAILDSGCNIRYEEGVSFVGNTLADPSGHGTSIAKIIKKINPDAKLYIAKVFAQNGRGLDTKPFVDGIYWAISRKVDVINMSWQIRKDDKAIHNAIKKAYQNGIIIVAAAGNKCDFIDNLVVELSKRNRKPNITNDMRYPAKYDEVIAIGAINSFWRFNRYEKYSPIWLKIEFVCDGSYGSQSGTSFASARATGIISKIKLDYPNYNGSQLREMLRSYTHDLGDKGRDPKFGYGKLDYQDISSCIRLKSN